MEALTRRLNSEVEQLRGDNARLQVIATPQTLHNSLVMRVAIWNSELSFPAAELGGGAACARPMPACS